MPGSAPASRPQRDPRTMASRLCGWSTVAKACR